MRVLFAIKKLANLAGGSEKVLCLLASELVRRGHYVSILTFDPIGSQPFYDIDQRVQLIQLGIGDASRPAGPIETVERIRALRRQVPGQAPDVAIGFNPSIFILMGPALWGTGIPVIGSDHIVPDHFKSRPIQAFMYFLSVPFLKKITVLSDKIKATYPRSIRRRMIAITNPVAPIKFNVADQPSESSRIILNVGRLDSQKDQATLIRAFAKIAPDFPNWRLRILGDGALRTELEALVLELSMEDRVALPGVTKEINAEYWHADIFALSSSYESFGLVTIEAMQHAKPVIAFSDCPGTRDIITNGLTGLLLEPGEDRVHALAEGLEKLMRDPKLRIELGTEGRAMVSETFSPEHVFDKWESLLNETALKN